MFNFFEFIFPIIFVVIFGIILYQIICGIHTWSKNNSAPQEVVPAVLVSKRMKVDHHHSNEGSSSSSTSYYATFQLTTGERQEFKIKGREYGLLAEQDQGTLSFQGTRYLSFERHFKI